MRLLVAVPSALTNRARRDAIRTTWCRRAARPLAGGVAAVAVKFFVGVAGGGSGAPAAEAALQRENATARDVVQIPGLVDAATNARRSGVRADRRMETRALSRR